MKVADFRSDTVTRPTERMRQAIAEAVVGDDVFGDDPTVNRLEDVVADMFGKEAALFVPSGTMGNQIAARVHAEPGSEVILEEASHCLNFELGGLAMTAGLQTRPIAGHRGRMDPGAIRSRIRSATLHEPGTGLVIVENTHNFAGGSILPIERLREIREVCLTTSVPLHIDGARIWNAAVATGIPVSEWAAEADSIMACLSKALGAPIGSVLAGSAHFIARARRVRKAFGGAMRQVGILAAAGLDALQDGLDHLADDHGRAARLAGGLAGLPGIDLDPETVETNIVIFRLRSMDPVHFVADLTKRDVLAIPAGPDLVRFVTHRDVDDADVDLALTASAEVLAATEGLPS
jgi:threonine aldolase